MIGLLCFFLSVLASPFKSASRGHEAENELLRHGRKRAASDATTTADRFLKRENAFSAQAADTNKQVLCDFLTVPTRGPSAVSTLVHVNFGEHPSEVESISQLALADGVNKNPHRYRGLSR
jgi:hypothetical protein